MKRPGSSRPDPVDRLSVLARLQPCSNSAGIDPSDSGVAEPASLSRGSFGSNPRAAGGRLSKHANLQRSCPLSHLYADVERPAMRRPCPPRLPGRRRACRACSCARDLGEGVHVDLDAGQANYLGNVMRLGEGAEVLLFDGRSGEWLARIAEAGKKRMALTVERRTREPETIPDVWLAFAPVKRTQTDWLVEKATELGVAEARARDDPADDRRAGKAGAAGSDRDRGGRAMRTHAASGDRRAGAARAIAQAGATARSISRTKAAASRRCRRSSRARRRS